MRGHTEGTIKEIKKSAVYYFLSAAKPTDQGKESVVLLLLVGGTIFQLPMYIIFGV